MRSAGRLTGEEIEDDPAEAKLRQVLVPAAANPCRFLRLSRGLEQRLPVSYRGESVYFAADDQHQELVERDILVETARRCLSAARASGGPT